MNKQRTKEKIVAAAFLLCVALVSVWLVISVRARFSYEAFELTGGDFEGFSPVSGDWFAQAVRVAEDPMAPTIIAHELTRRYSENAVEKRLVLVRLVHGYNMCDCMRIKGYKVELLRDNGQRTTHLPPPHQLWRLTSSSGEISIWVTSMLRAHDFGSSGIDVRDMAFPRVGIPDAQGWVPRGLSIKSLRHPIKNLRLFLRSKWNASRCDLLTFLGLRKPSWVSDDLLTLVSVGHLNAGTRETALEKHVLAAHSFMRMEYVRWWRENLVTVEK